MGRHPKSPRTRDPVVEEAGRESFPASDPPSWTGIAIGSPHTSAATASAGQPNAGTRRRHAVRLKRVYLPPETDDGQRVLVDRLWPRGLRKADAHVDLWLKEIAPSDQLRHWFGHETTRWPEFRRRYRAELAAGPEPRRKLEEVLSHGPVTLLFAAHDELHNNAVVLKEMIEEG